jgi:hypothetical protein
MAKSCKQYLVKVCALMLAYPERENASNYVCTISIGTRSDDKLLQNFANLEKFYENSADKILNFTIGEMGGYEFLPL